MLERGPVVGGPAVDARPRKPSVVTVGTVVWLASELMFFGGLFAAYFTLRAQASVWPPRGIDLPTTESAIATVVLVASSGTIHLATKAVERRDRLGIQRWLVITLVLGTLFLANQIHDFATSDFGISTNSYSSMYYLMTGFHGLHVFGGLVLLLIGLALTTGSRPLPRKTPAIESVIYYWHFVDLVWVAMFFTLFVLR